MLLLLTWLGGVPLLLPDGCQHDEVGVNMIGRVPLLFWKVLVLLLDKWLLFWMVPVLLPDQCQHDSVGTVVVPQNVAAIVK